VSEETISARIGVVKLVSGSFVVAVIVKLSRIWVEIIGPVLILSRGVENDKFLIQATTCSSKASLIACPLEKS